MSTKAKSTSSTATSSSSSSSGSSVSSSATTNAPSSSSSAILVEEKKPDVMTEFWDDSFFKLNIDPLDFRNFGLMNSHIYRERFVKIAANLNKSERMWVILLFTAIKSKRRVLESMMKFKGEQWYNKVRHFIVNNVSNYVSDASDDRIPAVNIPNINPSITSVMWIKITPVQNRTLSNFLKNLWAVQMRIPMTMKLTQKNWEEDFWNNTVKFSRNQTRDNVKLEFHEEFWINKASDNYDFYDVNMNVILVTDESSFNSWVNSF